MKIVIKKNSKHSIFFIILTFYLLFAPPIMGIHSMYFVAAFSWLYIFINNKYFFDYINPHKLKNIYLFLLGMFFWAALLILFNGGTKSVMYHYIYWMVAIFPGAIAICVHTKRHNETIEYTLKLIIWAAFIQSLISIVAFANNEIKLILIGKLQADDTLVMTTYSYEIYYRLFGFSSGLTFDMPSAMSIIACIAIYLGIHSNIRFLLFAPTIAFSAMINARTSIVVLAIGVLVILFMSGKLTRKSIMHFVFVVFLAVLAFIVGGSILKEISPLTYGWVESGINQLFGLFKRNTESGYFAYLSNTKRWRLPSGISILIGTGSRIMGGSKFGVYSDVGYINDVWFGGVLYSIVLYTTVAGFLWKIYSRYSKASNSKFLRFLSLTYMICLPILNIKTFIVSMGSFSTIFIIISVYSYVFSPSTNIKREEPLYERHNFSNSSGL